MRSFKGMKLLFAIVFTIPLVVWCFILASHFHNLDLLKNGIETTAVVTTYKSDVIVNDVPYYKLYFTYMDTEGKTHTGVTSADYTLSEAESTKTLRIKYNNKFESIQADYKPNNVVLLWVLPIFGAVGIGFWIAFFVELGKGSLAKQILKHGTPNKATFVSASSNIMINNVPYFYIQFEYTDTYGKKHQARTESKYSYEEQEFFQKMGKFDIMEYQGHAAINQKIDIAELNKKLDKQKAGYAYKTCKYCGSVISAQDKKCPNCGSSDFEEN